MRTTQPREIGIWARQFLRKLALVVTGPRAVVVTVAGAMLAAALAFLIMWLMATKQSVLAVHLFAPA
jgi:hypothetical protein